MTITRKQFVSGATATTVLLLFQGCGGGGGYGGAAPAPAPASTCGSSGAQIAGNHGHALVIASADLDSMVPVTYNIQAMADHNHQVTLSAAQLAQLKAHQTVVVTSTTTAGHNHDLTVTCA
jgi:hypothetical protein